LLTNYNRHMNGLRKREEAFSVWKDDEIPALADASNLDYFRGNYQKELPLIKRMQMLDINTFMLEACLMRADQTSMIHSLEVRLPFLDHRLVEYLMTLSPKVYFEAEQKKILLYKTLSQKIPDQVLSQPKRGFGFQHLSELFGTRFQDLMQGGELEKLDCIHKNTDWESVSVRTKFIFAQLELWCRRFSI
ncbi:MAG: asparagine synthase-related protein, partial [Pricia sp.]